MSPSPSFYSLVATSISGEPAPLSDYSGKVALAVNVASQCGFTNQYRGLQELYLRFENRGLVVLGFPSNDFLGQEPGNGSEIANFCESNFGITFPIFEKGSVVGKTKQPIFQYLTEEANPTLRGRIFWNFEKFLINRDGLLVARYRSFTKPDSAKIINKLEELLGPTSIR